MTGLATLRSGAGLVTVATPASTQPIVATFSPCYMTLPLVEDDYGIADYANVVDLIAAPSSSTSGPSDQDSGGATA